MTGDEAVADRQPAVDRGPAAVPQRSQWIETHLALPGCFRLKAISDRRPDAPVARRTAFGRSVYAVGGNASAAGLCGINVARIRILLFMLAGALAALSGILLAARLGSGNAGAASGLEFDVIAAVVVGGTSLSGGRGSMLGTLLGVLVITLIGNGLILLGINPFFQQVVRGLIIVGAVLANMAAMRRSAQIAKKH